MPLGNMFKPKSVFTWQTKKMRSKGKLQKSRCLANSNPTQPKQFIPPPQLRDYHHQLSSCPSQEDGGGLSSFLHCTAPPF